MCNIITEKGKSMFLDMPSLSHEQQQKAVEKIQKLISQGMSSGEAISKIAKEIREANINNQNIAIIFDDE